MSLIEQWWQISPRLNSVKGDVFYMSSQNVFNMSNLLDDVNELLGRNQGDKGRLEHIKKTLEMKKILYVTDKQYVTTLVKKSTKDNTIKPSFTEHIRDSKRIEDGLHSDNDNLRGRKNTDTSSNNFDTLPNTSTENSFCGNNVGSNDFCSKCGQSNTASKSNSFCGNCGKIKKPNELCQVCGDYNLPKGKKRKKIGKIILYLLGFSVILFSLIIFIAGIDAPAIIGGFVVILSLFVLVIGALLMYAGKRIKYN